MKNEFKVNYPKVNNILYFCSFLIIESMLIIGIFNSKTMVLGILSSISFFAICFFLQLGSTFFYVKVKGSTIKVRTNLGKTYEFQCSDIKKVICSKRVSIKLGPLYYITIITKSHEVDMEIKMNGFEEMARYIIEKHNNGEIKKTAISEFCKRELYNYERGVYIKRK